MGTLLNAAITDAPQGGMPPGVEGVVADVLLRLPVFKHIFAAKGCHPADAATLARLLRTRSVAIIPEGVAGIFHGASRSAGERVYLSRRRGFLRAALVAGTPVIPVYTLGNSQLLSFVGLPGLSRRLRVSVGLFFGLGGSPYPHRPRMLTVVGDPLEVEQCEDPTPPQVDELHGRLCAALTTLFDSHKALLGDEWAAKELVIE
jgi:1-acyl-sn-glycerol-3-phosphate acyltransferase